MRFQRLKAGISRVASYFLPKVPSRFLCASLLIAGLAGCGDDVLNRLNSVPEAPRELSFGVVPVGKQTRAELPLANKGYAPLTVFEVAKEEDTFASLSTLPLAVPASSLSALSFGVTPQEVGEYEGHVLIRTDSRVTPDLEITLTAQALRPRVSATPPALDFERVDLNMSKTIEFAVVNTGSVAADIIVVGIEGQDAALFSVTNVSTTLAVSESATIQVTYQAARIGPAHASLTIAVPHSLQSTLTIPLVAETSLQGIMGCLLAVPDAIEVRRSTSCPPSIFPLTILNTCNSSVTITAAGISPANSPFRFTSVSIPTRLRALQPAPFIIHYNSANLGDHAATLTINSDSQNALVVPLTGHTVRTVTKTDQFTQPSAGKIDILVVMDNSGSMSQEQMVVGDASAAFLTTINGRNIDYHLAVTTTGMEAIPNGNCPGGVRGGEAGRIFPVDQTGRRLITRTTANAIDMFRQNIQVGLCHGTEKGLESARLALSAPLVDSLDDPRTQEPRDGNRGFYRADANLAVIIISDEEDQSPHDAAFYSTFFQSLKPDPGMVKVHVVLDTAFCRDGSRANTKYQEVARGTGGQVAGICTTDWGMTLPQFVIGGTGLQASFRLSEVPGNPDLVVKINGATVSNSTYMYDVTTNAIIFKPESIPPAGSNVEITYRLPCQ